MRGEGTPAGPFDSVSHALRDQREINYLIIKGYTLSTPNSLKPAKGAETDYLRKFFDRVQNSGIFAKEYHLYTNEKTENLTGFYVILKLKETIRK